jgi:5S rRNA maturation endonuclease (ribonuclease M5)
MDRVFCPRHIERTPSCVIYETHAYCYGGCGKIDLSEIGLTATKQTKEKYVENLEEKFRYIDSLPRKLIRGFSLPYDDTGYYLCWPDRNYYKHRLWNRDAKDKYRGAAGHPKPIFWAGRAVSPEALVVVEGEMNALSISEAFPEWDVCSPGSASDFKTEKTRHFLLTYCTRYSRVIIVTDYDGPGTEAAIIAKGCLIGKVPDVQILLMKRDANEMFCDEGIEALRKEITARVPNL